MSKRKLTAADTARVDAIRRRHLKALATMRHGNPTVRSHALLTALLACGMTGPEAHRRAPWIAPDDLQHMIDDVDAVPKQDWTAQRLGTLVKLTDEERERGKLWSLRPSGIEWSVVQERVKARRRGRDRERQRKKRERRKMANDLDVREESLFAALDNGWTPVSALVTKLAGGRAWRGPDGRPITEPSLRRIVGRSLDRLFARGLIESQKRLGQNGLPMRLVRLRDLEATLFVTGDNGDGDSRAQVNARNPPQQRTSAPPEKSPPGPKKVAPLS
jgi:hypothetical protein